MFSRVRILERLGEFKLNGFIMVSSIAMAFLLSTGAVTAQEDRNDYVSDASFLIGTYQPAPSDHSPESMATTGKRFLQSLDEKLRERISHPIDGPERRKWTNLPADPNAGGVPLGELNDTQVKSFCDLMASLLSQQGYRKMCDIMLADDQLLPGGRPRRGFGTETFAVVIFGEPSISDPWAFQLDGHHIGVNVSITGDQVTLSPSFIGTQPETFTIGSKSIRPLAGEIDDAFKLAGSLSEEQFRQALLGPKRGQIIAGPGRDGKVPSPRGLSCGVLDANQKENLILLISHWVNLLPPKHAEPRMKQLLEELDQMHFGWRGPRQPASDVSYIIQGPSLIIEYACQDLGGNPQDHLHTMYRDPTNEYGKQLLRDE